MRITFQLRFSTQPGQSLFLTGEHESFGGGEPKRAAPLAYLDREFWRVTFEFAAGSVPDAELSYRYLLREADGSLVEDWGAGRMINPASFKVDEVLIVDSWNSPAFYENAFYTEPFRKVLLKPNHTQVSLPNPARVTHAFQVKAPLLTQGQTLCLLGNVPALGGWDPKHPVLLRRPEDQDDFAARLDLREAAFPVE